MPTIKDVARQAGVSVRTISNVLSGAVPVRAELRERVFATMKKLDYHPNYVARSLRVKIRESTALRLIGRERELQPVVG